MQKVTKEKFACPGQTIEVCVLRKPDVRAHGIGSETHCVKFDRFVSRVELISRGRHVHDATDRLLTLEAPAAFWFAGRLYVVNESGVKAFENKLLACGARADE
jgi:hypothetical protein